ncbi:MAG: hypothetical protein KGY54_11395 [Oleiphilaceae bacterium]|nr:hypothetical protein [Oleiphilaceae bacterium]
MRPLAYALLLALFLQTPGNAAASETRTYRLDNRPAEDVARQLKDLYPSGELAITAHGQQMIIRGSAGVLGEIEQLVETMDVAPAQLRISVRSGQRGNSTKQGGGLLVKKDGRISAGAERRVTTTRQNRERTLVMQDGGSAHITSGRIRTIPIALQGGRNPAVLLDQIETRSGFVVSPQVISDRTVELTIMSFEEDPANDMPGYKTEAVMTIRRVEPDQWVDLGSSQTSQAGNRSGITYRTAGDSRQSQSFEVKVNLL